MDVLLAPDDDGHDHQLNHALYITLSCLYGTLLVVVSFQLLRIFCYRHNPASFQFVFLILCLFWMLMRTVLSVGLAVSFEGEDMAVILPFLWIPLNFQFATYTLFVMFYAHVVHRARWEGEFRRRIIILWSVVNVGFLLFNIVWIVLAALQIVNVTTDFALMLRYLFPSITFTILAALLGYYGVRLYHTLQNPLALVPFRANGSSVTSITSMTVLLCVVFACRALYSGVMAALVYRRDEFNGEHPILRFLSVLISEIIPTAAILYFFRHIPRSRQPGTNPTGRGLPPAFYNSVNSTAVIGASGGGSSGKYSAHSVETEHSRLLSSAPLGVQSPYDSSYAAAEAIVGHDDDDVDDIARSTTESYQYSSTQRVIASLQTSRIPGSAGYGFAVSTLPRGQQY